MTVSLMIVFQGTGKMRSLYRGFVISRIFFIYFAIAGVKKIVRYTEDVVACVAGV